VSALVELLDQIAADEAGAAGDDDHFLCSVAMLVGMLF
jgi:hypothetical protein